jgi:26S proteasome regulatory subunit T4
LKVKGGGSKWSWLPTGDILDPALASGTVDLGEIRNPTKLQRLEKFSGIYARILAGDIDFEDVVKLADGLNRADMRNICTEAGLFAIPVGSGLRWRRVFMKAARRFLTIKVGIEKLDYSKGLKRLSGLVLKAQCNWKARRLWTVV